MPHPRVCNANAGFMVQSKHYSTAQLHILSGTLNGKTFTLALGSLRRTQRRLRAKVCTLWKPEHAIFQNMVWRDTVRGTNGQWVSVTWYFGLLDMKHATRPGIGGKKKSEICKKWKNNIIILQENNYNSEVNCSKILVLLYKDTNSHRTRKQKKMPSSCQTGVLYVNQEWEPAYNLTNMLISKPWIFKVLYWRRYLLPFTL